MARTLTAKFAKTFIITTRAHISLGGDDHPIVSTAEVDGHPVVEDDGNLVEFVGASDDEAEGKMLKYLEGRFGPRA